MSKNNEKIIDNIKNDPDFKWVVDQLLEAKTERFYGKITIQYISGNIVMIRNEKTQKPPGGRANDKEK